MSSPFWHNFESNGRATHAPVNDLREALAEVCEDFAAARLPLGYKRNALLKELTRLAEFYRDSTNWPAPGEAHQEGSADV
jgi:hypothetical protein